MVSKKSLMLNRCVADALFHTNIATQIIIGSLEKKLNK